MKAKLLIVLGALLFATFGLMAYVRATVSGPRRTAEAVTAASAAGALDPLWPVPAFSYPDQHGETVTDASLRGKVWVANFIFTQCRTVCPLLTSKMTMLMRRLEGVDARFVSFSVDPAHDTPEVLLHYKHRWAPDEARWTLLSTDANSLPALAKAFHVSAEKNTEGEGDPIIHSSIFVVVDAQGLVRGVFDSEHGKDFDAMKDAVLRLSRSPAAQVAPHVKVSPEQLYQDLKCAQCHDAPALAPSLAGRAGTRRELENGLLVGYDESYIRESLLAPDAKRVRGYPLRMPSYDGQIDDVAITELTRWLLALPTVDGGTAKGKEADHVETDVVCGMSVRVTDDTPRTSFQGHTFYFCAEDCKNRFVSNPGSYFKPKPEAGRD
ncbi:MAG: SCO family protein [Myxococcaceae bacterium]|nr:SCO family protein [Myxococcaceae bacterium]